MLLGSPALAAAPADGASKKSDNKDPKAAPPKNAVAPTPAKAPPQPAKSDAKASAEVQLAPLTSKPAQPPAPPPPPPVEAKAVPGPAPVGGPAQAPGLVQTASAPSSLNYRLDAREEYQLRYIPDVPLAGGGSAGSASDQYFRLGLDGSADYQRGRYNALVSADLWLNVARTAAVGTDGAYALSSLHDSVHPATFAVYQLAADYQGSGVLRTVRAGRQLAENGRPVTFDGVYALLRPAAKLNVFAFGGRTEHFYEPRELKDTPLFENWIASVGANYRLSPDLKLEADYRYLQEAVLTNDGSYSPVVDHNYGLSVSWRYQQMLSARAFVRGLTDKLAEVGLLGKFFHEPTNAGVDLSLRAQPTTLSELDELDNPFFATLGQSLPHAKWRLDAYKSAPMEALNVDLHLGYEGRRLLSGEEGPFNRNLGRAYLLASVNNLRAVKGLSVSASLDRIGAEANPFVGEGSWSINGSAAYAVDKLRAEAGVQYYRYYYQYFADANVVEMPNARVVYADARYRVLDGLSIRGRYSAEISDRVLHTLTVGLIQAY